VSPPSPVTIADAASPANPTGQVFNGNSNLFIVTNGLPPTDPNFKSGSANFIFDTENGTISGRSNAVAASQSFIAVDNSASGAVYKGLAVATNGNGTFLYAANFNSGKVDVFDSNFKPAAGFSFTEPHPPSVPAGAVGWAPFNVYNDGNGHLFVSYARKTPLSTMTLPGRATALSMSSTPTGPSLSASLPAGSSARLGDST
jgi:uncharacterized protein (TIGR03118 family)